LKNTVTQYPYKDRPYILKGDINNFNFIYKLYTKDFPLNERKDYHILCSLLEKDQYKLLLLKHPKINDILGYALIYDLSSLGALWLDYLAINANYRGMGYGTYFFQEIPNQFGPEITGMLLEVEIPDQTDRINFYKQKKRIQFYEKRGAKRLNLKYLFPSAEGEFPMHLYLKTNLNLNSLSGFMVKKILSSVFKGLHSDVAESNFILQKNLAAIADQVILN
jgi:GNAT superfamily N-acetyltransferase